MCSTRTKLICVLGIILCTQVTADDVRLRSAWKQSSVQPADLAFLITGTGDRNNPIRRQLMKPFAGNELFVRFRIRYPSNAIDTPLNGDGEFFVLWLDREEGGDRSTHSGAIPNIGIHVAGGENRFMVRYGAGQEKFLSVPLVGDREFLVVARLWKTTKRADSPFDQLDAWIDPTFNTENKPDISVSSAKSITTVNWIGFATGRKTEPTDKITVHDIGMTTSWREIHQLPKPVAAKFPKPPILPVKTVSFREHVYPILAKHCLECHTGDEAEARLDIHDEIMNLAMPGNSGSSQIISRTTSMDRKRRMPPVGKNRAALAASEIDVLRKWIDEGLEWDEQLLPTPVPNSDHWAFQPVQRPAIPDVANSPWVKTPVDAFVAYRHHAAGLHPSPPALLDSLLRRICLDLTGLPPSEALRQDSRTKDRDEFLDSTIDQLVTSVHFGERWGRHWLDVARWAESNGHQHNRNRIHSWRYRDYVVRSIQNDKPYDQFIREQIAGDELPYSSDNIIATGFLAAARYSGNELDKEIQRNDILVDVANTTAKVFLGLTLECSQCHSHKFDPISIRDYYRFQAFFANGQPGNVVIEQPSQSLDDLIETRWALFDNAHDRAINVRRKRGVPEPILVSPKSVVSSMNAKESNAFRILESEIAKHPQSWSWHSRDQDSQVGHTPAVAHHEMRWPLPRYVSERDGYVHLLLRGDINNKGPVVDPGWPLVFGRMPRVDRHSRVGLANWMTSRENPLSARVWVNRIWQWHFGRGLVETSGDFGTQGQKPSHPELLDWLASELIDSGWSSRHIHKLILKSSTYQLASVPDPQNQHRDPDNRWIWRWLPRRLESEAIRDSILFVAGELEERAGGPSVDLADAAKSSRRSIYIQQKRDKLPDVMTLFDSPNATTSCSRRTVSTVALQPLFLLNSDFMVRMSTGFASRLRAMSSQPDEQIARAIELALNREPEPEELSRARELLDDTSLESFCLVLLNLNEFVYIP